MDRDDIVETLNDLIQICEDSQEGYRQSADAAADADLKALFSDLADQRGGMVRELQTQVAAQGSAPETGGTVLGRAHRMFVNLKSMVTGHDREAVLREVERGEGEAIRRYENALDKDLPTGIAEVVRSQLDRIRGDRHRVETLRSAAA